MGSIEWKVTEQCNYSCEYCGIKNNSKKPETNKDKLLEFIKILKIKQYITGFEIFLFGGEPFLHPNIDFILDNMNKLDIKYLIQTNLSKHSTKVILSLVEKNIKIDKINVSIHSSQTTFENIKEQLTFIRKYNISLVGLDVMFLNNESIKLYRKIKKSFPELNMTLCPITDLLVSGFGKLTVLFNTIRNLDEYNDINFEDILFKHPDTGKLVQRSQIWEEFHKNQTTPKGKICLLKDKYFLYDSHLLPFNCCFNVNVKNNICIFDNCSLS